MGLNSTKILGINVTIDSKEKILEVIGKYLNAGIKKGLIKTKKQVNPFIIVTPNPEQIVLAQDDKEFSEILNGADVAIPDGNGVIWASRTLGNSGGSGGTQPIKTRIAGVELVEDLLPLAIENAVSIGLIGGWGGVALKALERLQARYPGLEGWAEEPSADQVASLDYMQKIVGTIEANKTGIVFVGVGAPRQEKFINALKKHMKIETPVVLMAVGGSLDVISGKKRRAPFIFRAIGIEWLWRLAAEPWRWRRQMALARFISLILKEKN